MGENLPIENTPPPAGGKTSKIFFVIAAVLVLVIARNGIVLLRQAKEQKTKENISDQRVPTVSSVQPTTVSPTVSEGQKFDPEPNLTEIQIFDLRVDQRNVKLSLHSFTRFVNKASKAVVVSVRPGVGVIDIYPGQSWTRSYEERGKYTYEVRGLKELILGEIFVE